MTTQIIAKCLTLSSEPRPIKLLPTLNSRLLLSLIIISSASLCYARSTVTNSTMPSPPLRLGAVDPNSYAVPDEVRTKNIDLEWQINFEQKTISGKATYTFQVQEGKTISNLLLDVDDIVIESILFGANSSNDLKYTVSDFVKTIGSKLSIELPEPTSGTFNLTITYETSPKASALQWLTPAQTLGKKHPYLFSQCQPIQARSLLPCQDTPAVKFTYTAIVRHPENLTALLSAVRLSSENGVTKYEQTVPIPSYLLAIAVGDIVSRPLGPISNVWAEAAIVDEAAEEFSETAKMLQAASDICGEYVWKQYDLLVMPPSFPFGGMENPCLTFVTPTLLTGDKSQATVVAHEIAHSWTGNLVTNANFEHFWLNEGFTMFIQGKITGAMQGAPARDFQAIQALSELRDTIKTQLAGQPQLTKLVVDLSGPLSPEDSFSRIPYHKGQAFLRYIEDTLGGAAVFDPFLRSYFEQYKYQSIVTEQFKDALYAHFNATKAAQLAQIDWDLWLFGVGMPPVIPAYDDSLAQIAHKHAELWANGNVTEIRTSPLLEAANELTSLQRGEMLDLLVANDAIAAIGQEWIDLLESTYGLSATASRNCDLRVPFARLCIKAQQIERLPEILTLANSNFRMKYARPIYRDLGAWPQAKDAAVENFYAVKDQMMAVCSNQVAKDLGINQ